MSRLHFQGLLLLILATTIISRGHFSRRNYQGRYSPSYERGYRGHNNYPRSYRRRPYQRPQSPHSQNGDFASFSFFRGLQEARPGSHVDLKPVSRAVSLECPAVQRLPQSQCSGERDKCRADQHCREESICCFNGCVKTCYGFLTGNVDEVSKVPIHSSISVRNSIGNSRPDFIFEDVLKNEKKCVDKVDQVEETVYEETEECSHTYEKKCHISYSTEYENQQVEECEENFKKSCEITFSPHASNVSAQVCMRPLVPDCNLLGPDVCRTEYITECSTRNNPFQVLDDIPKCRTVHDEKCEDVQEGYSTKRECKKWPREVCRVDQELRTKIDPETKCEKVPQTTCGPEGCSFVPGPEQCYDKVVTVVTDLPEESCDIQPRKQCSHVTKLVPKLTPVEECSDIPREVCTKAKHPRKVIRAVTKKWCYHPSQESGLQGY